MFVCSIIRRKEEKKKKPPPKVFFPYFPFTPTFITLTVPYIAIDDDRGVSTPEKFYRVGSTIELKCIIDKIPHRANFVIWKHGMRMLNYDTSRGGIRLVI